MSEQLAKLDERTRQALESMMYSIFDNAISDAFTRGYEKGRDDAIETLRTTFTSLESRKYIPILRSIDGCT